MKTGKKAIWVIVSALVVYLVVGLCFMPRDGKSAAAGDESRDTVTERNASGLATAEDSLSYAVSIMVASEMPRAMQELGITADTRDEFIKGLVNAFPADASPEAMAYAQGVVIGASAMEMLDEANYAIQQSDSTKKVDRHIFLDGLKAMAGGDAKMSPAQARDYYYSIVFRLPSEEFIKKNSTRSGVVTIADGVQVKVEREGTGEKPSQNDIVAYIYKASYINGNSFDSSRGEVVKARVNSLLPGLSTALTSLPVGTKCKLYLPWQQAYGSQGSDRVPPYSAIVYDLEIVNIVK